MTKYKIYELYNYTLTYNIEAESEEQAIELMQDDPYEYRDFELEDCEEHNMVYRIIEKVVDNDQVIRSN
jgi:hypothetical protein